MSEEVYMEMETLETETLGREAGEGVLIPGLPPPPTNPATNPANNPTSNHATNSPTNTPTNPTSNLQRRNGSAIVNTPRRINQPQPPRRCLIHLVVRCPICFRTSHHRNPRFFRQDGIRAILTLIRDVFGVNLNPRELALFIAGYYA